MVEDPQPVTLQQRIASLNAAHVGRTPSEPPVTRPKPQIPLHRPTVIRRQKTINTPPAQTAGSTDTSIGNEPNGGTQNRRLPTPPIERTSPSPTINKPKVLPPPLPRRQSTNPSPALPARRPSETIARENSVESISSTGTSFSGLGNGNSLITVTRTKSNESASRMKAPGWGESDLPPLPTKQEGVTQSKPTQPKYTSDRPKYEIRAPTSSARITPATPQATQYNHAPPKPSLPPRLPARKPSLLPAEPHHEVSLQARREHEPVRNLNTPVQFPDALENLKRSASSGRMHKEETDALHGPRSVANGFHMKPTQVSQPPPVPLASRPDVSAVQVAKPHTTATSAALIHHQPDASISCLACRDFSAPDHYATLFPRSEVTSLQSLAQQLTAPFPSLTDKSRVLFTWLHHNISYDVDSFFSNNVRPSTPQSTLQSGLAVCEGYAGLFTTLASHAGLESIVIGGHGKGYGYTPIAIGAVLPPYHSGHAWNAVRIDDGEWKLIDACWGSGHVQGPGMPYVRKFAPQYFTMSNEEFGIKHFPRDKDLFFLPGGRRMEWEEYMRINPVAWPCSVEPATLFSCAPDYGIGERTVLPRSKKLWPGQGGIIRFQFSLVCPHWTLEHHSKKGPPPVFVVVVHGSDGRNKDFVPMEHVLGQGVGGGGAFWYCDVEGRELGAQGQIVTLFAITSFGDRQNCRGLSVEEFKEKKGKVGMAFQGVAAWELV